MCPQLVSQPVGLGCIPISAFGCAWQPFHTVDCPRPWHSLTLNPMLTTAQNSLRIPPCAQAAWLQPSRASSHAQEKVSRVRADWRWNGLGGSERVPLPSHLDERNLLAIAMLVKTLIDQVGAGR